MSLGPIVKAAEFTPPPKVDSRVLVMEPHQPIVEARVFDLIMKGFSAPRKKLIHNLASLKGKEELKKVLIKLDISVDARPADLHLDDWQKLSDAL